MYFHEGEKSEIISELFNLFSLIVHEVAYLEDQKTVLAENNSFYPETTFSYLKNFMTFINHSISRLKDESGSINIFDPDFLSQVPIQISEKIKYISYENLMSFFKFNDINEIDLTDLESFKSFYFPSNDKGFDYQSFLDLCLPYSNKTARKNCIKRKILYEVTNLESLKVDLKLQTLLSQNMEDEINLFKRTEEIKIKLINEMHWDPIEAFNNLDYNSLTYLDFASLEKFFKNFGEKFSPKDYESLLRTVNKNSNSEIIYFEDFKKLTMPFKTYFTLPERTEKSKNSSQNFTKSQVFMERVDQAVNDDKYVILKSTFKGDISNNVSQLSNIYSPSKIRQAVFDDNLIETNPNHMNFSTSKFQGKSKSNYQVSNLLNASQKPIDQHNLNQSIYASKNEGVLGKNMVYSRFPTNKIIQDLYGEHKFTNLNNPLQTPVKEFPNPIINNDLNRNPPITNFDIVVNGKTNFDNENLLKAKSHDKKIYTPIRQDPQLLFTLNNEFQVRNDNLNISSPILFSTTKRPLFYSNTKEMQNNRNSRSITESMQIKQSTTNYLASPGKRKIFDNKGLQKSNILTSGITSKSGMKTSQKLNEPGTSKRTIIENNTNKNISKPTPPLMI